MHIPLELRQALKKKEVVFFCGAGVSKNSGLPDGEELLEELTKGLNLNCSEEGELDAQMLHIKKGLGEEQFKKELHKRLQLKEGTDLEVQKALQVQKALLKLSLNQEGLPRLVTTNIDDCFQQAAKQLEMKPCRHIAPALPTPRDYWASIVYLHGKLEGDDPNTSLVLCRDEFGEAYLEAGWARNFVVELFRHFHVVLIGYSNQDVLMKYFISALVSGRELGRKQDEKKISALVSREKSGRKQDEKKIWAFVKEGEKANYEGIEPIVWKDEEELKKGIIDWAKGELDFGNLRQILRSPTEQLSKKEEDEIIWALHENSDAFLKACCAFGSKEGGHFRRLLEIACGVRWDKEGRIIFQKDAPGYGLIGDCAIHTRDPHKPARLKSFCAIRQWVAGYMHSSFEWNSKNRREIGFLSEDYLLSFIRKAGGHCNDCLLRLFWEQWVKVRPLSKNHYIAWLDFLLRLTRNWIEDCPSASILYQMPLSPQSSLGPMGADIERRLLNFCWHIVFLFKSQGGNSLVMFPGDSQSRPEQCRKFLESNLESKPANKAGMLTCRDLADLFQHHILNFNDCDHLRTSLLFELSSAHQKESYSKKNVFSYTSTLFKKLLEEGNGQLEKLVESWLSHTDKHLNFLALHATEKHGLKQQLPLALDCVLKELDAPYFGELYCDVFEKFGKDIEQSRLKQLEASILKLPFGKATGLSPEGKDLRELYPKIGFLRYLKEGGACLSGEAEAELARLEAKKEQFKKKHPERPKRDKFSIPEEPEKMIALLNEEGWGHPSRWSLEECVLFDEEGWGHDTSQPPESKMEEDMLGRPNFHLGLLDKLEGHARVFMANVFWSRGQGGAENEELKKAREAFVKKMRELSVGVFFGGQPRYYVLAKIFESSRLKGAEALAFWKELWEYALSSDPLEEKAIFSLHDAINHPCGKLAEKPLLMLFDSRPKSGGGIPPEIRKYTDCIFEGKSDKHRLGQLVFARLINNLFFIDPKWTRENLIEKMRYKETEMSAYSFWDACTYGELFSRELLDELEDDLCALLKAGAKERQNLPADTFKCLVIQLAKCCFLKIESFDTEKKKKIQDIIRSFESEDRWTFFNILRYAEGMDLGQRKDRWGIIHSILEGVWPGERKFRILDVPLLRLVLEAGGALKEAIEFAKDFDAPLNPDSLNQFLYALKLYKKYSEERSLLLGYLSYLFKDAFKEADPSWLKWLQGELSKELTEREKKQVRWLWHSISEFRHAAWGGTE